MRLLTNHRKGNEKKPTTWRLNNMLLKNQWVNDKIKEEIKLPQRQKRKHKLTNTNPIYNKCSLQCNFAAAKAVLRGKVIAIQAFLKKREKSQTNNLSYHIKN